MPYQVNDNLDPNNYPPANNIIRAINILATQVKLIVGGQTFSNQPGNIVTTHSFASNGDANGCFYWIGTDGNTVNFSNPAVNGNLLFFPSSVVSGSEICTVLSDRALNNPGFVSNNVANSWVAWDLGTNRKFQYTSYSLRHRTSTSFPGQFIRNWKLQGSNNVPSNSPDGGNNATWVDLDTRTSNTTINSEGAWGNFNVSNPNSYRFGRIIQTGGNSSGNNSLVLGEVEIYGTLTTK